MRWVVVAALVMACRPRPDGQGQSAQAAQVVVDAAPVVVVDAAPPAEPNIASIDKAVDDAIVRGDVPGAVVVVWSHDKLVHRKAYGHRRVVPDRVPMTVDTVFDLASLTKPLATTLSIHRLIADKRIALHDPVKKYLPELDERITIEHLLLHTSGLPPAANFPDGNPIAKIASIPLKSEPGTVTRYSDLGFILLAEVVRAKSGYRIDHFASKTFYEPLHLEHTRFLPPKGDRFAPTVRDGVTFEGVVHDPRAAVSSTACTCSPRVRSRT